MSLPAITLTPNASSLSVAAGSVGERSVLEGAKVASEIVKEIGGAETVAVMMKQLCEDAADADEDSASILLDGPSVADLLLDARDVLAHETGPFAITDPMWIQPSNEDSNPNGDDSETVFYPAMEAATSCVITLQTRVATAGGKKSSIDSFLANLSNAYKGAKREENAAVKLRISLIAEQGRGPQVQALEFRAELDYWGFVSAVSRAVVLKEEDVRWTGVCELPSGGSESASVSGAAKQKILSIFTGSKGKPEVDSDRIDIHGKRLTVISNGVVAYSLDLNTLRALALTSDWVEPKPYILEIRIASEGESSNKGLGGTRLALMGTDLEPVVSAQYYHSAQGTAQHIGAGINENILLPLSLDEVVNCKSVNGLTSVAVLTGTKYNAESSHPAGIHTIPFGEFVIPEKATRRRRASVISYSAAQSPSSPAASATKPLPQLRLNEPIKASIPITQDAPQRAVRVLIKGSTDIPSSRLGHPSAYCAVYLVDDRGNKISDAGGVIEAKTEVVKGNNPTWNNDLYIELPSSEDGGNDTVSGVMIMVKDAGGGLLKPLHLGQVVVPIGCFIENHEAQLTLPLEPTVRMPRSQLTLGEIHIITQLAAGGSNMGSSPASSPSCVRKRASSASAVTGAGAGAGAGAGSGSGSGSSLTAGGGGLSPSHHGHTAVPVSYTLRPSFALGVSWPFRVLSSGGALTGGEINTGHLACGQTALRLVLSPGHGGVLASCLEARGRGVLAGPLSGATAGGGGGGGGGSSSSPNSNAGSITLSLDWSNVCDIVAMTEASLMVTVRVRQTFVTTGGRMSISGKVTQQSSPITKSVDISLLVAPCPSRKLQEALSDRLGLAPVRAELKQLVSTIHKAQLAGTGSSGNSMGMVGGAGSGVPPTLGGRQRQASTISAPISSSIQPGLAADAVLPIARFILEDLERVVDRALQGIQGYANGGFGNGNGGGDGGAGAGVQKDEYGSPKEQMRSLAPCAVTAQMRKVADIRNFARARLYQALLMHVCKSLARGPTYTLDGARAAVEADIKKFVGSDSAPLAASALATQLHERHAKIAKSAVERITDYILCSAELWRSPTTVTHSLTAPLSISSAADLFNSGRDLEHSRAAECLCELIRGYHAQLRGLLASYTASADAFKRTPGQEAKMAIMRLIMDCDSDFDKAVQKKLQLLGVRATPALTLLGSRFTVHDLVGWYQSSLVVETQTWLSKTIQNFSLFKLNTANLPWDIDEVGERVISALPETLQQQMAVYLSLCNCDEDDGSTPETRELLHSIREKIVEAVAKCMLLLSDEYRRALQSKRWERPSRDGDDLEKNFMFLISVANDCLRVSNFQVDTQLSSPGGVGGSEVHTLVVVAFNGTADIAIKYLIRIIFSEAYTLLADFDEYWATPSEQACKTLIGIMSSYFTHLRPKLDERFVEKLLVCCAGVVVTRLLLMLRVRGSRGKRFSADDVKRFCFDAQQLRNCFQAAFGTTRDLASCKPLSALQDVVELLSRPLGEIRSLMKAMARDHVVAGISAGGGGGGGGAGGNGTAAVPPVRAGALLLQFVMLQLRPDGGNNAELEAGVTAAVDEASKIPLAWHPFAQDSLEQTVVQRVFGSQGLGLGGDSGGGSGGGGGGAGDKDKGALKQLREKATNAFLGKKSKRKMEEEDVRILRLLGLELDLIEEAENFAPSKDRQGQGGLDNDNDNDDKTSVAGSMMGAGALQHIDEADLVIVKVSQLRIQGLTSHAFFGSVNPYVAITLGETRLKTAVAWNSSTGKARWDAPLIFRYSKTRLTSGQARLRVEVFDKERVRRKRALGGVTIKLAGLELFRIESWFALEGGETTKQTGELFLVVDLQGRTE